VQESLLIRYLLPSLNVQSDSIRAKPFSVHCIRVLINHLYIMLQLFFGKFIYCIFGLETVS